MDAISADFTLSICVRETAALLPIYPHLTFYESKFNVDTCFRHSTQQQSVIDTEEIVFL